MKTILSILSILSLTVLAGACGQDAEPRAKAPRDAAAAADATLSDDEVDALALDEDATVEKTGGAAKDERAAKRKAKRDEIVARFDADGDGRLDESERKEARKTLREELKAKVDTDGDGKVSPDEKKAAVCGHAQKVKEALEADGIDPAGRPRLSRILSRCQGG